MSKERVERESPESSGSERSRKAAPTEARAGSRLGVFAGRASSGRFGAGQQGPPGGGDQGRFDGDQPEAVAASALAFQAKLAVGGSEDPAEREADAVAAEVVSRIARRDFSEEPEEVNRSPAQRIRRRATVGSQGGPVDTDTEQRIQARRGNGTALPPDVAEQMGAGFGADFSNVRLHTGTESAELNSRLQARAFTVGNDIFLGNDTNIRSSEGQELLAHELTHTIQQEGPARLARRKVAMSNVADEGPVKEIADSALSGQVKERADATLKLVIAKASRSAHPYVKKHTEQNNGQEPKKRKFKWGVPHRNIEGHLPGVRKAGGFTEFYINEIDTNGEPSLPPTHFERLVVQDQGGAVFHTDTHYGKMGDPAFTHLK